MAKIILTAKALTALLTATSYVSDRVDRGLMRGCVTIERQNDKINFYATDGHRLHFLQQQLSPTESLTDEALQEGQSYAFRATRAIGGSKFKPFRHKDRILTIDTDNNTILDGSQIMHLYTSPVEKASRDISSIKRVIRDAAGRASRPDRAGQSNKRCGRTLRKWVSNSR